MQQLLHKGLELCPKRFNCSKDQQLPRSSEGRGFLLTPRRLPLAPQHLDSDLEHMSLSPQS